MIIVNADDWGRSREETDVAGACYADGLITSATAMVFMADSTRAARIAHEIGIDVGLHLNFTQRFTGPVDDPRLLERHGRIVEYLTNYRYAGLIYNPRLRPDFENVFRAQYDEFIRLYGRKPSHIDGHHHQHLCANMILGRIIPAREKVRRSFHFWPGEKVLVNRAFRSVLNRHIARRHVVTDYFFALSQSLATPRLACIGDLAARCAVEIMTHPVAPKERAFLWSDDYRLFLALLKPGTYSDL